jgi:ribosomal protein S18 acetylase RimI-like enzyme
MEMIRLTQSDPREYFRQIARLHDAEIHHGALPLLGTSFLARLYHDLAGQQGCGIWALFQDQEVQAFLVGCDNMRTCFRSLLLRSWLPLSMLAAPRLISWRLLRRLPSLLLYPFKHKSTTEQNTSETFAELLAIAVNKRFQGRGIGKELVARFEEFLGLERKVSSYEVTTNAEDPDSNAFYRKMGFQPTMTIPHHSLILQRYYKYIEVSPAFRKINGAALLGEVEDSASVVSSCRQRKES